MAAIGFVLLTSVGLLIKVREPTHGVAVALAVSAALIGFVLLTVSIAIKLWQVMP